MAGEAFGFFAVAEEVLLVSGHGDGADGEIGLAELKEGFAAQGGVIAFVEWQGEGAVGVFADLITGGGRAVDGDVRVGDIGDDSAGFAGKALDVNELSQAGLAFGRDEEGTLATQLVEGEIGPDLGAGGQHTNDVVLAAPALQEHVVQGGAEGERALDDGVTLGIHGGGGDVLVVDEEVEVVVGFLRIPEPGIHGGGSGGCVSCSCHCLDLNPAFQSDVEPVVE